MSVVVPRQMMIERSGRDACDGVSLMRADECLEEVRQGIGPAWEGRPLYGASRSGLTPAKEAIGKQPERYKAIEPGTVFYNPMRILLGSIAMLDDGEEPGITSPDYVVVRGRPGVLHHRVFYYWLRSAAGEHLIRELARGGVRERILFNRLCEGLIPVPSWPVQERLAEQLAVVPRARAAAAQRLATAEALPASLLREVFEGPQWPIVELGDGLERFEAGTSVVAEGRPAGDHEWGVLKVSAVSWGQFRPHENKAVPPGYVPGEHERVRPGDFLISRANTAELAGAVVLVRETPDNLMLSDKTLRLVIDRTVFVPEYLEFALRTRLARTFIEGNATGTSYSMRNISQPTIRAIPVPKPEVAMQRQIVATLSARLSAAEALIARCREELADIEALPAALLRAAFNGAS